MQFLDKLERKYPQLAIEGLMRYVSLLMLTVFFLNHSGMLPYSMLRLNSPAVMQGQVWRLFTFLLIPVSRNMLFLIFELSILVMCADGLEARWGTFRVSIYYFCGALANIIVAFMMPGVAMGSYFLYLTFFLGFATVNPNYEILIFFILPVRVKYLAMLSGLWIFVQLATAPIFIKVAILLSVGNYLLFFGKEAIDNIKGNHRRYTRAKAFAEKISDNREYRHKCTTCGITEVSDPEAEFRYCTCSQCGTDGKAFCTKHLKEHKESLKDEQTTG